LPALPKLCRDGAWLRWYEVGPVNA